MPLQMAVMSQSFPQRCLTDHATATAAPCTPLVLAGERRDDLAGTHEVTHVCAADRVLVLRLQQDDFVMLRSCVQLELLPESQPLGSMLLAVLECLETDEGAPRTVILDEKDHRSRLISPMRDIRCVDEPIMSSLRRPFKVVTSPARLASESRSRPGRGCGISVAPCRPPKSASPSPPGCSSGSPPGRSSARRGISSSSSAAAIC